MDTGSFESFCNTVSPQLLSYSWLPLRRLAEIYPSDAQNNADNYCFFINDEALMSLVQVLGLGSRVT